MKISRVSPLTGELNSMELDVTMEQMEAFYAPDRPYIQVVFPNLTAAEREFIKTGYTPEDWATIFPDD